MSIKHERKVISLRNKNYFRDWIKAAGIRAIKTIAQCALSMVSVGMTLSDIDFKSVVSVSLVAGVCSLLTSIAGLPEVKEINTEGGTE